MKIDFEMNLQIGKTSARLEIREEGEPPRVGLNTRDVLNIDALLAIMKAEMGGFAIRTQRKAQAKAQPKTKKKKAVKRAKKKR